MKCHNCKIQAEAHRSDVPACCVWYMENVVIGGKSANDCPMHIPVDRGDEDAAR